MIQSFIESASSFSGDLDDLFLLITVLVGFWFILVEVVIFYFIFRFRRKDGVKAQYITGEKKHEAKWIHVPHYAVIACDVVIIVVTVILWTEIKMTLPPAQEKIRVIGQQWTWIFEHPGPDGKLDTADDIKTVNDLHLKVNTVYHVEMQAKDVLHNFSIPVFRYKQDTIPGRTITGWFEPTKTGRFDVQCAEMCGIGHGVMSASLTVETEEEHQKWMESVKWMVSSNNSLTDETTTTAMNSRLQSSQNAADKEFSELLQNSF